MASKALLLIGALGAAAAAAFAFGKRADAQPAQSGLPDGWTPPSGATFTFLPPSNPTTLPLNVWSWRDPGTLGLTALVAHKANPKTDFVAVFIPDNKTQGRGILARGTTPNSGLIAQAAAAGLIL